MIVLILHACHTCHDESKFIGSNVSSSSSAHIHPALLDQLHAIEITDILGYPHPALASHLAQLMVIASQT